MTGALSWLALFVALGFAPLVIDGYAMSVLILIFFYATVGQAWNLAMGYTGILSLGHALFIGLGGYVTAVLAVNFGITPWLGIPAGAALGAAMGALIAWLGFRFAVRGVYFALLTIAFAEFFRILFDNWDYLGGTGGFFFRAPDPADSVVLTLRGGSEVYYYGFLVLMAATFFVCRALVGSRWGYFWRAIREDEDAARALGVRVQHAKILVVTISTGLTGAAGGLFALLNGNLFPDSMMSMRLSIEMIIAPIIGGLGTLAGPIIGAFIVVPVMKLANEIGQSAGIFGFNTFVYGLMILVIIVFLPGGLWPWITRILSKRRGGDGDA